MTALPPFPPCAEVLADRARGRAAGVGPGRVSSQTAAGFPFELREIATASAVRVPLRRRLFPAAFGPEKRGVALSALEHIQMRSAS